MGSRKPTGSPPRGTDTHRTKQTGLSSLDTRTNMLKARMQSVARELVARRQEIERLLQFSPDATGDNLTPLDVEPLLEDVAATVSEGYVLVSLMIRDFTHVRGKINGVRGDELAGRGLPWEDITARILLDSLREGEGWARLGSDAVFEIGQICGRKLEGHCFPIRVAERAAGFVAFLKPTDRHSEPPLHSEPPSHSDPLLHSEPPLHSDPLLHSEPPLHSALLSRMKILEGLAYRIARALGTLQLRSELHGFLFDTVKSLVAAVDAKDPYTRGHSERVHYLAVLTGTHMGLDPQQLQSLSWAAILHDIGKISIPRKILCKPSGLTKNEQEIIRTHPVRGCEVIWPVPQFVNALAGIRHHHERFDGGGYPGGLAGFEIPLSARIIAVADAFDAITSNRPYFPALSCQEALQTLGQDDGHFDPDILPVVREIVEGEIASGSLAFGVLHHTARRAQNAPGNRDDLRSQEAA